MHLVRPQPFAILLLGALLCATSRADRKDLAMQAAALAKAGAGYLTGKGGPPKLPDLSLIAPALAPAKPAETAATESAPAVSGGNAPKAMTSASSSRPAADGATPQVQDVFTMYSQMKQLATSSSAAAPVAAPIASEAAKVSTSASAPVAAAVPAGTGPVASAAIPGAPASAEASTFTGAAALASALTRFDVIVTEAPVAAPAVAASSPVSEFSSADHKLAFVGLSPGPASKPEEKSASLEKSADEKALPRRAAVVPAPVAQPWALMALLGTIHERVLGSTRLVKRRAPACAAEATCE